MARAFVLIFSVCSLLAAQLYQPAAAAGVQEPIAAIRKQYSAINKRASRYKKVRKELSGFSLEGGELVAYLNGSVVVKLVARHYGESGNSLEEYYYSQGQLIFVFERVSHYSQPLSGKVVHAEENRFYFNDDNLIRWIGEKGKVVSVNEDYRLKERILLENSNKFLIGARSANVVIEAY